MKTSMGYATALGLAVAIINRLDTHCRRIEIAGSLRRQKAEIGDLEFVAIPHQDLYDYTDDLLATGRIRPGTPKAWGTKLRRFVFMTNSGRLVTCELWLQPSPATWGINYMIRTGSADFAHKMVTPQSRGGWMPDGYKVDGGRVWLGRTPLDTREEEDVFRLWGMDYVPPHLRTNGYKPDLHPVEVKGLGGLFDVEAPA